MRTSHGQADHAALLTTVLELVTDGIWDWNINSGQVCRSPRWYTLLGYQPEDLDESLEAWSQALHPDDVERVLNYVEQYRLNQISKYQLEYRLKTKSGRFVWVEEVATITEWNPDGTPARMIGAFRDISRRKNSFEQLSSEKYTLEQLINERTSELLEVNTELARRIKEAERQAEVDQLTGIANRYRLEKVLELEVERASRFQQPLSIIALDIDDFKRINDEYGHASGDMVMIKLSRLIKRNIREIDLLARWGGDEFMIILPNTALPAALITAEKLRKLVASASLDRRLPLTISLGVAQTRNGESAMRLSLRADSALYQSKEQGKNRINS